MVPFGQSVRKPPPPLPLLHPRHPAPFPRPPDRCDQVATRTPVRLSHLRSPPPVAGAVPGPRLAPAGGGSDGQGGAVDCQGGVLKFHCLLSPRGLVPHLLCPHGARSPLMSSCADAKHAQRGRSVARRRLDVDANTRNIFTSGGLREWASLRV